MMPEGSAVATITYTGRGGILYPVGTPTERGTASPAVVHGHSEMGPDLHIRASLLVTKSGRYSLTQEGVRGPRVLRARSSSHYCPAVRLARVMAAALLAAVVGAAAGTLGPFAAAPGAGAVRDPWRSLLARVPASGTFADFVIVNDYAAARAAADLTRHPDRIHDLLVLEKTAGVAPSALVAAPGSGDPLAEELGIRTRDVERDVVAGDPPGQLTILEGSIDPAHVRRAVRGDGSFSDRLATARHAGKRYYTWGSERVDPLRRTPLRPLGIGGNLAVDPPYVAWSNLAATVEASIDAAAGTVPSLADDRDLVAVADALQARGGYAGFLAAHEVAPGVATGGPTPLAPYDAIAIGPSLEDADTPVLVVALAYPDAATARSQAGRLRALAEDGTTVTGDRWSEFVTVDDVTTDGRVVVGRLRTERPRLWFDVVLRRDSLLASA